MMRIAAIAAGVTVWACLASPVTAQPTTANSISLQAKLSGVPDGTVNLDVRFYDAATGGSQRGPTISLTGVPVQDSIVSVPLSPIDPTIFNGQTRYMGISVNAASELTPRTLVTAVPYSASTRGVSVNTGGYVGLGTDNPERALHVRAPEANLLIETTGNTDSAIYFRNSDDQSNQSMYIALSRSNDRLYTRSGGFQLGSSSSDTDSALYFMPHENYQPTLLGSTYLAQDKDTHTLYMMVNGMPTARFARGQVRFGDFDFPQATFDVAGSTRTRILTITGGSDLAEPFDTAPNADIAPVPGMVMAIDPDHPGKLMVSRAAYDTRVAGVISGANGLNPGMIMQAEGVEHAQGEHPVAMTGRVWVFADTSHGPITPGDRLTTSAANAGHAARVADESRSPGTVIGKAMTELKEGSGLVLVLVNLQ